MHFATVWESIAEAIPESMAITIGDARRSWAEWEERSARMAGAFAQAGLGSDAKIGLYLYNSIEYCETQFAAFKGRGVPININYRYLDDELHYLLDNSDAEALVYHSSLGERVARVMDRLPRVKLWIEVDDGGASIPGSTAYEALMAGHDPAEPIARPEDDVYMLYTGGTTGMPKGVMYRLGGMTRSFIQTALPVLGFAVPDRIEDMAGMVREAVDEGRGAVSVPACPMMHATGGWIGTMMPHCAGGHVACLEGRHFDAHELWGVAEREQATQLVIVGDAFAKPMLRALEEARAEGRAYDTSSIKLIISSGVMWSADVKQALHEWGDYILYDAMGSTEGSMATSVTTKGGDIETAKFVLSDTTKVFTEDGREVVPGSGEKGMLAAGGNVPFGYFKDPEKSAATFKEIDGVDYSFPGDWATVDVDGTIHLLGRGSQCINSAGEKIYPEEVEEAVKLHPAVVDCLVIGLPDEKFGERVTAIASLASTGAVDAEEVRSFTRTRLAAYKVPKQVLLVEQVQRAPNGKADYKWAKAYATEHA